MLAASYQLYKSSLNLEGLGQEHRNQTLSHFCLPLEPELDPHPAHIVTQEPGEPPTQDASSRAPWQL